MPNNNLTCSTCRFWQPLDPDGEGFAADRNYQVEDDGDGLCRRNPPQGQRRDMRVENGSELTFASDAALWAQWPVTTGDHDWCGEHRPVVALGIVTNLHDRRE